MPMLFHLRRTRDVPASRLLGVLFLALLARLLFDIGVAAAQEVKQIKLTEKQLQGFIAAHPDMAKLYDGANPEKPDPKVDAQAAAVAKKNGFASLAEHAVVTMNVDGSRQIANRLGQPEDLRGRNAIIAKGNVNVAHAV